MTKYRIVPKRDFGRQGFLINGKWIKSGFVVTDGFCNIMPGATWFLSIEDAMRAVRVYATVKGDAQLFWKRIREADERPRAACA